MVDSAGGGRRKVGLVLRLLYGLVGGMSQLLYLQLLSLASLLLNPPLELCPPLPLLLPVAASLELLPCPTYCKTLYRHLWTLCLPLGIRLAGVGDGAGLRSALCEPKGLVGEPYAVLWAVVSIVLLDVQPSVEGQYGMGFLDQAAASVAEVGFGGTL